MTLIRSIRAELAKFRTVRSTWILALVMLLYVGACAAGFAVLVGVGADNGLEVPGIEIAPLVYSLATTLGYVFPVLIGALAISGEVRFQTLTPTFLATPRRGTVLAGKLVAAGVMGAVLGVVALVASAGIGGGILAAFGLETGFGDAETWALLGRAVAAMVLWALVGVGLGSLVTNQVVVIVIVLAFTQFIEPTLRFAVVFADWIADVARFLPGAASDALVGSSVFTTLMGPTGSPLEYWQGALVLLGIAGVLLVAGAATTWRRDVT